MPLRLEKIIPVMPFCVLCAPCGLSFQKQSAKGPVFQQSLAMAIAFSTTMMQHTVPIPHVDIINSLVINF